MRGFLAVRSSRRASSGGNTRALRVHEWSIALARAQTHVVAADLCALATRSTCFFKDRNRERAPRILGRVDTRAMHHPVVDQRDLAAVEPKLFKL